jgi:hypothetical protein
MRDVAATVCFSIAVAACLVTNDDSGVTHVPFVLSEEYTASGDFGDGQTANRIVMVVDDPKCLQDPKAANLPAPRGSCYAFTYLPLPVGDGQPGQGFGGVAWQSPPNNWGEYPAKRIAQGAKSVHFAAATDTPGLVVTFGVGAASSGPSKYPYTETFSPTVAQAFTLTAKMQAFTLSFGAFQKYDRVLVAFNWTISDQNNDYTRLGVAPARGITLYVDDIVWGE